VTRCFFCSGVFTGLSVGFYGAHLYPFALVTLGGAMLAALVNAALRDIDDRHPRLWK
jgi:hypothetical protein